MKSKLAVIRKAKGYSQISLSRSSGIPRRTIEDWERYGLGRARLSSVKRVADVLECLVDELI